ncbi:splicing factor, Prp19-binding domain-containing protein [Talaromyces proteolyticus]|uniref:Splicing factor, Prp19-binding domain-containing protein n=1 Tax=Talaromyces proteolyticus TaxID=1131652 RepID=A0AAD4L7J7_9EURO|nr:splicing factor, Prp19-binding domain-containing protein [Talaromyces proteolyticus]KAH8705409.1 splicing factor, Prp19-binding domain-containing protein [Talaromyces proteolyticus]
MPPQFPSTHRGMTANPLKPVKRYRPGKALVEEKSSDEEEESDDAEEIAREEQRRKQEEQARRRPAPKATSFPGAGAGRITKGVRDVQIAREDSEDEDEDGFVTDEDEEPTSTVVAKPSIAQKPDPGIQAPVAKEEEEDEDSEEEESSEEESSEEEQPKRVLLRPTFIKKDNRKESGQNGDQTITPVVTDSAADAEARRAQRQEKANDLVRDQLEKEALARVAGKKAWDEDENVAAEEEALDDRDGLDPDAEYAAWKLRELKRIKRQREAIEEAEKEREEIERRRNLNPEEREREDQEFIGKQKEEKEANRGQAGYMRRYFHKGAFFRDDLEREGLDKRDLMGARFADDTSREVLPEYMQIRDMTKLGKKGRTRYKDLRSEDTGRWGEGFARPRRPRDENLVGITDERFLPDSNRRDDREGTGATGANASAVRERRRSGSRRRSRSRSYSPRKDRYKGDSRQDSHYSDRPRDRSRNRDRRDDYRKRSHSPDDDRDKRRRVEN